MRKHWIALLLILVLLVGIAPVSTAEETEAVPQLWYEPVRRSGDFYSTDWEPLGIQGPYNRPIQQFTGGTMHVILYYGTCEEDLVPVEDLQVESGWDYLSVTDRTYAYGDRSGTFYIMNPKKPGTGTFSFTVDGVTKTQDFTVGLPLVSFFRDSSYTADSWLNWKVPYEPGKENTFWILQDPSMDSLDETNLAENAVGMTGENVILEDGSHGIRVTIPATVSGDHSVAIYLEDENGNRGWDLTVNLVESHNALCFRRAGVDGEAVYEDTDVSLHSEPLYLANSRKVYFRYGIMGMEQQIGRAHV